MTDFKEDTCYEKFDHDAKRFDDLDSKIQEDLIAWYNVRKPTKKDKQLLFNLYKNGNFSAWDCPKCGDRVFEGRPDNWNDFQGTLNQDFSYFGDEAIYKPEFLEAMCDDCRCHSNSFEYKK